MSNNLSNSIDDSTYIEVNKSTKVVEIKKYGTYFIMADPNLVNINKLCEDLRDNGCLANYLVIPTKNPQSVIIREVESV